MPDKRLHRGSHPEDAELFAAARWPALRSAMRDLCWLLDRGYALRSALALTGDRYELTQRQRLAVARCACSREQAEHRAAHRIDPHALAGQEVWIDGYNLLITIEAALGGGVIIVGRDGCYRDMASLHGTYREVAETGRAAELIGATLQHWGIAKCRWLVDRPVGNSGRLKSALLGRAEKSGWPWTIDLELSPDRVLAESPAVVVSSDSVVLDRCARWCNAAAAIIMTHIPGLRVLDLRGGLTP